MQWPPNENKIKAMIETFFTAGLQRPISCSSDTTTDASEGKELAEGHVCTSGGSFCGYITVGNIRNSRTSSILL